jgi:16S rRNA (cytosine1402-N4)-methyltransferase
MLEECMSYLSPKSGKIYFDGTLGGGGHSEAILSLSAPDGLLVAVDRDGDSIAYAQERLKQYGGRVTLVKDDFKNCLNILDNLKIKNLDGAILDLGVSSRQIDDGQRGFSYMTDAPLDMRMDRSQDLSAYDVINGYDERQLVKILFEYGEERFAKKICAAIVKRRSIEPIKSTKRLSEIVSSAARFDFKGGHPCKRTFQAIRIEVNGELSNLGEAIKNIALRLNKGGRLCVISFHSLEDRIVKHTFKFLESSCICDKSLPCVCNKRQEIKLIAKAVTPSVAELKKNSRAQSAKLRVIERI